jgi:hypothetical protein
MRRAPAGVRLERVAPQSHLPEDAADRIRLVAPDQIRKRIDRVPDCVEAASALRARHRMRLGAHCARSNLGPGRAPHELVQHGAKAQSLGRLAHRPNPPAHDRTDELANA